MKMLCRWILDNFGYSPHRTTIVRIVSSEQRHDYLDSKATTKRCNHREPALPDIEQELRIWIERANSANCSLTGDIIMRKAQQLAKDKNLITLVKFSKGWLYRFQQRRGLQIFRLHGEAASIPQQYDRRDIYNMDETGIFYNCQPNTTISNKARSGMNKDKNRISVVLAANTDGSDKRELTFIDMARRPRCFGNLGPDDLSLLYKSNRKAWMTIAIFSEWIGNLNESMKAANRRVLLLPDNASSHKCVGVDLTHVRVLLLPPNTTAWLQPMDAGINASFKCHYKRR
ncbi:Aste57867_24626 [Aphanomyces stellatus]|uniref:Aste57867_24626 protein n=1 Tax=Aphanomyces stellatus TaxID=120398 RepID=A0A485LRL0_9STRA|nr:hypothetical protein As57867_024548 [Aphanomyces stellatus]VFU01263.1 Aste57867_24626 [Aphanomyces stellatus]